MGFFKECYSTLQLVTASFTAERKLKRSSAGARLAMDFLKNQLNQIKDQASLDTSLKSFEANNKPDFSKIGDSEYGYVFLFTPRSGNQFVIEALPRFDVVGPNAGYWKRIAPGYTLHSEGKISVNEDK